MRLPKFIVALILTSLLPSVVRAEGKSGSLDDVAARSVSRAKAQFPGANIRDDQLAVSLIDLTDPAISRTGSFRGSEPVYPASVIKLFYLVATHRWLQDDKLDDSDELQRMLRDMIVDSSNDATGAVVDALSGVGNGEPLPQEQMKAWAEKRHLVNRYFTSLGYTGINVCQKAYAEGPYGRERVFLGEKFTNRNMLTTDATARLMAEIAQGRAVTPERSKQMMDLLKRDPAPPKDGRAEDQGNGYTGKALPPGSRLWSKAGWTNTARHDVAYVETPDGGKFVLAVFTTGHARNGELLPAIAKGVIEGIKPAEVKPAEVNP